VPRTLFYSAVITTKIVITPTTSFSTTTSTLNDRTTQVFSTSRSVDLTITIPITFTSTLSTLLVTFSLIESTTTEFTTAYRFIYTTRNVPSYTFIFIATASFTIFQLATDFRTARATDSIFATDTNATIDRFLTQSTVFFTAETETLSGFTTQTFSRIY